MRVYFFLIFLLNINIFAGVDIILKSFQDSKVAEKGLNSLEGFIKDKNLTVSVKLKEMNGLYYLKIGTFSDSIRNDEKFLALFAIKYPDMMIVKHREQKINLKNSEKMEKKGNQKEEGFWSRYESLIQWLIMIIMAVWGAIIMYLRIEMMKKVSQEQNIITKEQNSIEITLKKSTKQGGNIKDAH